MWHGARRVRPYAGREEDDTRVRRLEQTRRRLAQFAEVVLRPRSAIRLSCVVALLAITSPALADKTEADRLFEEGVKLRGQGLRREACAKFEQAMKQDERAVGTLLNLALCAEQDERFATAVKLFSEARDRAREQGLKEHLDAAVEHLDKLTPHVSHLEIKLARTYPSMKILVDDAVFAPEQLAAIPLDPGKRTVTVSAPQHLPYETTTMVGPGAHVTLEIPELAEPVAPTSHALPIAMVATGAAAVAVGALLIAIDQNPDMSGATKTYRDSATAGVVVGASGLVLGGIGAYLWYRASLPGSASVSASHDHAVVGWSLRF